MLSADPPTALVLTEILAEIDRRREARPMDLGVADSTALIKEDRDR